MYIGIALLTNAEAHNFARNIEPLGFDGAMWRFHSTLTVSKVNKNTINQLYSEYHDKDVDIEFEVKQVVMFCNLGDSTKTSDYFSLKIFDLGC